MLTKLRTAVAGSAGASKLIGGVDGWPGLESPPAAPPGEAAAAEASAAGAAAPLEPALAAGETTAGRAFVLHAGGGRAVVYALAPGGAAPLEPAAPRPLSSFFPGPAFGVGSQDDYRSAAAAFDKASRRFLLAAASRGNATGSAPSVLWLGASLRPDPRHRWRALALAAPPPGDARNHCPGGMAAVWEVSSVGYDEFGAHVAASLACAPPEAPGDAGARVERRAWLLSLPKSALYHVGAGVAPGGATLAAWDATGGPEGAVARAVALAAPQARADVNGTARGSAFGVAVVRWIARAARSRLAAACPAHAYPQSALDWALVCF